MYSRPDSSTRRPPTSLFPLRTASITGIQGKLVGRQRVRPHRHLVLTDLTTYGRDLGHARHALHGIAHEPVLVTAQLVAGVLATSVHEGVLKDPAEAGGVRAKFGLHAGRKLRRDLRQVFEDPRARPVDVGAVLEDHVDVAEAEIGVAADRFDLGRAQQRGDNRVGNLVFDDVRAAIPARIDDDLRIRQIRQGIERNVAHGPVGNGDCDQRPGNNQVLVLGRKADDPLEHG
jgi:hypothetical protein